ncbi:MAG: CopG family transcriptional regulator [Omnitrophica bacterium RIFCSPHIGHO2_02_FULL_63_14]|nr:MAG: CopG family transcriptional regulator [Omnitrophica bacterium RIFCSPHIGHO2_02_FULL_63_14]
MKKKIDPDMPVGKLIRIKDFLPPPNELALPSDTVKITIFLKKSSVEFFKSQAAKHGTKYQRMIRELLDKYAEQFKAA